jgi:hypothetical protein
VNQSYISGTLFDLVKSPNAVDPQSHWIVLERGGKYLLLDVFSHEELEADIKQLIDSIRLD